MTNGCWQVDDRAARLRAVTNPYKILQVDPATDSVVVRAASRALARIYHPDFGGDVLRCRRFGGIQAEQRSQAQILGAETLDFAAKVVRARGGGLTHDRLPPIPTHAGSLAWRNSRARSA